MNPLSPLTYNAAGPGPSVTPSDIAPAHENTTADVVKECIGESHYENRLSVADNIVQALNSGTFPTAAPITLRGIVFNLGWGQASFTENVTLEACQVNSGEVAFYHGTAEAVQCYATVVACGEGATANASGFMAKAHAAASGATANATANGAHAYATASGATANATVHGAWASATASGATANALAGEAWAFAQASGATANATAEGAKASSTASGTIANAIAEGAKASATASGATANATTEGAEAYATKSGATANATAGEARAIAEASNAIANATVGGARADATRNGARANATAFGATANARASEAEARAWAPGSIAIAWHAMASLKVDQGKAIQYREFRIISEKLKRLWDLDAPKQVHADGAFEIGMAFCDGNGVKQSDTLATFFLSAAHGLKHPRAAFELGELYSKKRLWIRQDARLADRWYSKEPKRELASKYALMLRGMDDNACAFSGVPKDVIKVIGSFLGKL